MIFDCDLNVLLECTLSSVEVKNSIINGWALTKWSTVLSVNKPESIVRITEDQAFSPYMIWLLPPSLPPPPPVNKFNLEHTGRLRKRNNLLTAEGGRGWTSCRILRLQEKLVLYNNSFSSLWYRLWNCPRFISGILLVSEGDMKQCWPKYIKICRTGFIYRKIFYKMLLISESLHISSACSRQSLSFILLHTPALRR